MDDPNAPLPCDPAVDESYTKSSASDRPRKRAGSKSASEAREPRREGAPAKKSAAKARTQPETGRGKAGVAGLPRTLGLSSDGWYRHKLSRRLAGVATCLFLTGIVSHVALATAPGQVVDTILMEGTMRSARHYDAFSTLITGLVSVPVMVIAGTVVALVAAARRRPTLAGRALGAVIGANITTQILKEYVLTRPTLGVTTGAGNSLPSGHTTVAVTISLALVVVAPKLFRSPSAWIGWAWSALMGVSVMMEGWHRPADVITAVLIAGAWALAPQARGPGSASHGVDLPGPGRRRDRCDDRRPVGLEHVRGFSRIRLWVRGLPADPPLAFARPGHGGCRVGECRVRARHA